MQEWFTYEVRYGSKHGNGNADVYVLHVHVF